MGGLEWMECTGMMDGYEWMGWRSGCGEGRNGMVHVAELGKKTSDPSVFSHVDAKERGGREPP
jgi:hypothetical protein